MQETNVRIRGKYNFSIQLKNQPKHTVSSWVLRTKVEFYVLYGLLRRGAQGKNGFHRRQLPVALFHRHELPVELLEIVQIRIPLVSIAVLSVMQNMLIYHQDALWQVMVLHNASAITSKSHH